MSKKRSPWPVILGVAAVVAAFGLIVALNIVSREGWEGLWNRKKEFIKGAQPGAGPLLDEAEKQVRGQAGKE